MLSHRLVQLSKGVFGSTSVNFSRNYVRKITPLNIVPRKGPPRYEQEEKLDPELLESIQSLDDAGLEPDISQFHRAYGAHAREDEMNRKKIERSRMARKHFKPFMPKEVSLLTYAEKEKIRFLHKSDPNQWSVEALAEAFPITENGVFKLIKSTFRCRFPDEIVRHDNGLIENLRKIKSGQIQLSPEIHEKMKLRNSIPLNIGQTSIPEIGSLVPIAQPKKLGQFARMVAKPQPPELAESDEAAEHLDLPRNRNIKQSTSTSKGSISVPPPPPPMPLENYDSRLLRDSNNVQKTLNLDTGERMTMADFESRIKETVRNHPKEERDIRYLLNQKEPAKANPEIDESELINRAPGPKTQEYIDFGRIVKYKRDLETKEKVEVTVDQGRAYIYDPELGYQRPFGSKPGADRIQIPPDAKKEGSVYRVGDSYFDENGSFLYRVI